ncbi:DUF3850 domain-containing protein, partial [Patescibacteria group bacterium]
NKKEKTFDMRLNDFECEKGDLLVLEEWDPDTKKYTGRILRITVGYVLKFNLDESQFTWPKEEIEKYGLQVISLRTDKKSNYELIDSGICPRCNNKMRSSDISQNNGFDWFCDICEIHYHFMDDPGPGSYVRQKIK